MKIAIVYDAIYPDVLGGGEKRNWEVARRLAVQGHEVYLLGMQSWVGASIVCREKVVCVGVCPAKVLFTKSGNRSFFQPLYFAFHLYRYLRRNSFDLIDCSNFPYLPCLAVKYATFKIKTPLVITWYEVRGLRGWLNYTGLSGVIAFFFERLTARLTSFNIAISALTGRKVVQMKRVNHVRVIPCGVDCSVLKRGVSSARVDQILYVGRLVRHKRVDMILDALRQIAPEWPSVSLTLVGTGYQQEALQSLAVEYGLREKVHFAGGLDEGALIREFGRSRVFVLPSEQEGFGIVILEAMAAGVPVIALDAERSAALELITHGINGFLVKTVEEMVIALRQILAEPDMACRIAKAGQETAQIYDWDTRVIPDLEAYYRQVLDESALRGAIR